MRQLDKNQSELKKHLADVLSVLALTMSTEGERESLKYRLLGYEGDIGLWRHEYVRNLAGEVGLEYANRKQQNEEAETDDLMELVKQIVAFHMKHNAEPEPVDLLIEVEGLDLLLDHVDITNFKRTCLYLASSGRYLPTPDETNLVLDIAYLIYMKFEEYPNALQIAMFLDNLQYISRIFTSCNNLLRKKQLCYILARHGTSFEIDDEMVAEDEDIEALQNIINHTKLSEGYLGNLSSYYPQDANLLFCVRIAQGLLHMGKGLLTLNPYHSDRFLLSPTALAGTAVMLHACLHMKAIILGQYHYSLYFLVLTMQPRILLTVGEDLKPLAIPVRVGKAVDVVGQVGKPNTITGFQTHSTPVVQSAGEIDSSAV